MRATDAYRDLLDLGRDLISSTEARTRWQVSPGTAAYRLKALDDAGLVRRVRRGLWAVKADINAFVVPPYLTAPFPAYVSVWSALSYHDMIEQIPREVSVASLDRARRIETSLGTYQVHHLAPEVFGGFEGSEVSGYLATPEKAVFDTVYLRAAVGTRAYFPELLLPSAFDDAALKGWTEKIKAPRQRTLVSRHIREVLKQATRQQLPAAR